ncbi:hypothetical protein [Methylobacter svalbardensis]|uniref:hypothetical protein n=1 Tax=Methylobacter svalbardensis TaxID=3080016 RepID=UPI0030EF9784
MLKIKCYESSSGKNEVQETYDSGTEELKAELEVALAYLKVRNRQDWRRPHAHKMSKCKEFRNFFETRFFANRLQQRPIGYFGPEENDFTILIWATEKGNKLNPENWCGKSNRRREEIINGNAKAKCLKLEGDPEC